MGGKSCCVNATVKTWGFTQPWSFLSLGLPDRIQGLLLVLTQERSWWLRCLTRDWVLSTSSNLDAGAGLEAASASKSQKSGLFQEGSWTRWRGGSVDGSAVRGTCCSSRGPSLVPNINVTAHDYLTPTPGIGNRRLASEGTKCLGSVMRPKEG